MTRSLQRRLTVMLCGAVTLAALLAVGVSFVLAYSEAREFQDDMLRQIASLSNNSTDFLTNSERAASHAQRPTGGDPESRIMLLHFPGDARPIWLSPGLSPGLRTIQTPEGDLRVFISPARTGVALTTVVAQRTATRDEIAINSALRTLIPLLLLLPVLATLILWIVRSELEPVKRLSAYLDAQPADDPAPLSDGKVPAEILPFVQAINRLLNRVTRLVAQQRRFIADAAHELRSPLTAMSLQVNNLKNAESLDTMHTRLVPLMDGIARTRRLTEQLLDLARTQAEQNQRDTLDISLVIRDLLAEFMPMAQSRGIDLGMEADGKIMLNASLELLRRTLANAIDNALKYTPPGGQVTVICYADGDFAVIDIVDSGPGIDIAEREQVFDAFYRAQGAAAAGTGLGLAIARESALRNRGEVSLHARGESGGVIFRYRQPRD